ncbi:MAG: ATP-binding cassette domain-containing protein [Bacteroidota bacterium]|jgi:ABC-2 type transport system ATP-binding protein|nr:ATP-binding cassette domain-containing protein [Bacteroidales bacterium]MDI9534471.1 ATP-binding cassette domain-containing protein [Bacteroidota bacterium]OQC45504.1 MAG: Lipopolysaccharide export system ATP-binding protein LptB [Bacteroidetes bacterium ADurb.Bin028]NLP20716.1 ABC transporter ATP-binding protein [Bacteroidales bacterium]HNY44132.1 ATP-binding cassette domain-containing protein [Bacteroidales bacterium]
MNALVAENVEKKFANHLALDDVSITVPEGSVYGLLGPNGAGKTTLIRIINQITAPDKGQVFIYGEKMQSKHVENIGYLPEERGLYKKMKVGEQALYLCQLKGLSKAETLKRLKYWFEKFEIQSWWDKKVEELSKGMQQKVQFIITVLHKPKLLIFDEPFSGFDPINTKMLKDEILNLRNEGATIIFSTHNMASVEEICDHIALINKSRKILEGPINEIRNNYASDIYEITFEGYFNKLESTLTSDYKILDVVENSQKSTMKVEVLNKNIKSNDLITIMTQYGNISSFQKHLPSMNDIFIKVVEETNTLIK